MSLFPSISSYDGFLDKHDNRLHAKAISCILKHLNNWMELH